MFYERQTPRHLRIHTKTIFVLLMITNSDQQEKPNISLNVLLYPVCPLELHPDCDPGAENHRLLEPQREVSDHQK